jgi:hypothetical protein
VPKSVIEIDVNDAKFKAFVAAFAKFQDALGEVNDETKKFGDKTNAAAEKGAKGFAKFRKELDALHKTAKEAVAPFVKIASLTTSIASSVASTSFNLAKWAAFGALGGGFGLGGLASSAVSTRREALGYGVTSGGLRAARTAYGQYLDADSLLAAISKTQFDPTALSAYNMLGIKNPAQKNPLELLGEVATRGGATWNQYKNNPAALALLSPLVDDQLGRTLFGLKPGEAAGAAQRQRELQPQYEKSDEGFRKFWQALQESGQALETSLIGGLNKLTPQLTKFVNVVTKIVQEFLASPRFDKLMEDIAVQLERFAKYLVSPEFETDVKKFQELIFDMVEVLEAAIRILKPLVHAVPKVAAGLGTFLKVNPLTAPTVWGVKAWDVMHKDISAARASPGSGVLRYGMPSAMDFLRGAISERQHNPGDLKIPGHEGHAPSDFQSFASDEAGLRAMANQLSLYYNRDKLDTINAIVKKYAPRNENKTAEYISGVARSMGIDPGQRLDLNDRSVMSSLMAGMTKQENARSNFTPQGIRVVLEDRTGGSAVATANTLSTGNAQ